MCDCPPSVPVFLSLDHHPAFFPDITSVAHPALKSLDRTGEISSVTYCALFIHVPTCVLGLVWHFMGNICFLSNSKLRINIIHIRIPKWKIHLSSEINMLYFVCLMLTLTQLVAQGELLAETFLWSDCAQLPNVLSQYVHLHALQWTGYIRLSPGSWFLQRHVN